MFHTPPHKIPSYISPQSRLPAYRSHKVVRAAKILDIGSVNHATLRRLTLDCGSTRQCVDVSVEWVEKHSPGIGGYFVVYADGYESYSPARAFAEGYTRIDAPADAPKECQHLRVERHPGRGIHETCLDCGAERGICSHDDPLGQRWVKTIDFGDALRALKAGKRVARQGWNGRGMWLAMSPGVKALPADKFWAGPNREHAEKCGGVADVLPCLTMKTATGEIVMGWLASQSDMLADDWVVV